MLLLYIQSTKLNFELGLILRIELCKQNMVYALILHIHTHTHVCVVLYIDTFIWQDLRRERDRERVELRENDVRARAGRYLNSMLLLLQL